MRWLTLIEVYAEMSQSWKRVHLHKVLIFIFQFLPQNFQLLSSELPMTPLSRFPVVGCHFEGSVRFFEGVGACIRRGAELNFRATEGRLLSPAASDNLRQTDGNDHR
jgi:hypothetical protein